MITYCYESSKFVNFYSYSCALEEKSYFTDGDGLGDSAFKELNWMIFV